LPKKKNLAKMSMMSILNNEDITVLDRQIEQLTDFKPIPEHEVKILCEKVTPL
jgi:hypothetical protein